MAGSQLKRLKASLREQGITGPQQSKKQKRRAAQDERARGEKRLQRGVILEGIREQFNPFDLKHAARGPKFEVTTNHPPSGHTALGIKGRPGLSKAASEERRRQTLLVDMQRRNKVGGISYRRFGEDDPTMTPEDKMLERFAREKQKSHKRSSLFDLEDDGPQEGLTHMGESLTFDEDIADDFEETDLNSDDDSDGSIRGQQRLKRLRALATRDDEDPEDPEEPKQKKTKKEVMEEVMAKSKLYRMERQAAKEEDSELRAEIDKELPNIQMLLASGRNAARRNNGEDGPVTTIAGVDRVAFERNFDLEVKRLAQDKKAQPTNRTKTEEEVAEEGSERLKELEDRRQRRMRGEEVTDSESDDNTAGDQDAAESLLDDDDDSDDDFGLGSGIRTRSAATELGFDDEDDFVIDHDLVASGSDLELVESDEESQEDADGTMNEEDDEFTKGLLNEQESRDPVFDSTRPSNGGSLDLGTGDGLPFTFPCPSTLAEFHSIVAPYPSNSIPTIIQRIRALYHPKLGSKNKERLASLSEVLVDYISSPEFDTALPFSVIESVVRHIHSLAKMFPIEIATKFRLHLEEIGTSRPLSLQPEDLMLLTAIGSIFPTSDHFHQVVTPAMLTIARYLGQKIPQNLGDYATGLFLSILALQYQQLSKRYIPEVVNFILNTIWALVPVAPSSSLGNFPIHQVSVESRAIDCSRVPPRRLTLLDCEPKTGEKDERAVLKVSILEASIKTLDAAADTWKGKEAFVETFDQAVGVLTHMTSKDCRSHLPSALCDSSDKLRSRLNRMLNIARLSRRPLQLHHHRPLAIKTFIPKFEETFDPDKHYDPDRERAELAKLRAEHKKERKGAMRELRKDANFMARENLRVKKAKDEAYEKKYKRLVAEIQSEEGKEANAYEREKQARKRSKNR